MHLNPIFREIMLRAHRDELVGPMAHFPSPPIEEGIEDYPAMQAALGIPVRVVTMKPTRDRVLEKPPWRSASREWGSPSAPDRPSAVAHLACAQKVAL